MNQQILQQPKVLGKRVRNPYSSGFVSKLTGDKYKASGVPEIADGNDQLIEDAENIIINEGWSNRRVNKSLMLDVKAKLQKNIDWFCLQKAKEGASEQKSEETRAKNNNLQRPIQQDKRKREKKFTDDVFTVIDEIANEITEIATN